MKKSLENTCLCDACQQYFSISTIAHRWQVSQKTVRRMLASGKIKAKRIGGSIRIPHSEVIKAIEDF